jgi:hypothetical protein
MGLINAPVLCSSAHTLGISSDLIISDRQVVSGRPSLLNGYGLFPVQAYITTLGLTVLAFALPPVRWFLRSRLKGYSYNGNPSARVILDVRGLSTNKKSSAIANCVFPGDGGIYATGLFAAGVANAIHEATSTGSKHPRPLAGFHPPVAALRDCRQGLLVDHLRELGSEIKVEIIPEEGGAAREVDITKLRSKL